MKDVFWPVLQMQVPDGCDPVRLVYGQRFLVVSGDKELGELYARAKEVSRLSWLTLPESMETCLWTPIHARHAPAPSPLLVLPRTQQPDSCLLPLCRRRILVRVDRVVSQVIVRVAQRPLDHFGRLLEELDKARTGQHGRQLLAREAASPFRFELFLGEALLECDFGVEALAFCFEFGDDPGAQFFGRFSTGPAGRRGSLDTETRC